MAALTATKAYKGELAGEHQLLLLTATVESDSDTITLTAADHDAASIVGILGSNITGGIDDKFTNIQVSYSDLTITITSVEQDGTASTAWTDTTVSIALLIKTTA
jgi:hypothetical protein